MCSFSSSIKLYRLIGIFSGLVNISLFYPYAVEGSSYRKLWPQLPRAMQDIIIQFIKKSTVFYFTQLNRMSIQNS